MVGAEDIDEGVEAAGDFVVVVADIRHEIGVKAIGFDDGTIFVIAEFGRLEEGGAVFLIKIGFQVLKGFLDVPAFADIGFIGELVEIDAEFREVFLQFAKFGVDAEADEEIMGFLGIREILIAILVFDGLGDVDEVDAMVIVIA